MHKSLIPGSIEWVTQVPLYAQVTHPRFHWVTQVALHAQATQVNPSSTLSIRQKAPLHAKPVTHVFCRAPPHPPTVWLRTVRTAASRPSWCLPPHCLPTVSKKLILGSSQAKQHENGTKLKIPHKKGQQSKTEWDLRHLVQWGFFLLKKYEWDLRMCTCYCIGCMLYE